MSHQTSAAPPGRPNAITFGVPYLVVLWVVLVASAEGSIIDDGSNRSSHIPVIVLWTVIWSAVLYRVWRAVGRR